MTFKKSFLIGSLFCFVVGNVSADSPCKRGKGASFTTDSRGSIQRLVIQALATRDEKSLVKYASCDFLTGAPESDTGSIVNPVKVMTTILKVTSALKWKKKGFDYGSQYNLPAKESRLPLGPDELVFGMDDNKRWYWAGYLTFDPGINGKLSEGAY